jgi:hypothetical protein
METSADRGALIDLLTAHEMAMGELYAVYADQFSAHAPFFGELAREERGHAEAIERARARLIEDRGFDGWTVRAAGVRTSLGFLRKQIETFRIRRPALVEAVGVALDFERSLIEKCLFAPGKDRSVSAREVFTPLSAETVGHIERLQAFGRRAAAPAARR